MSPLNRLNLIKLADESAFLHDVDDVSFSEDLTVCCFVSKCLTLDIGTTSGGFGINDSGSVFISFFISSIGSGVGSSVGSGVGSSVGSGVGSSIGSDSGSDNGSDIKSDIGSGTGSNVLDPVKKTRLCSTSL
ncbi:hypothetical protein PUN28_004034 [Cardiocondyla obscurior]|uniref:Uncharacterized protein n=1 Tax=Cardiocondyla obscurior TaxID=286306 RepID=A0AAW2GNW8_9HYME